MRTLDLSLRHCECVSQTLWTSLSDTLDLSYRYLTQLTQPAERQLRDATAIAVSTVRIRRWSRTAQYLQILLLHLRNCVSVLLLHPCKPSQWALSTQPIRRQSLCSEEGAAVCRQTVCSEGVAVCRQTVCSEGVAVCRQSLCGQYAINYESPATDCSNSDTWLCSCPRCTNHKANMKMQAKNITN